MAKRKIRNLIVHHSVSSWGDGAVITEWHTAAKPRGNGWGAPGYHVVVCNGYTALQVTDANAGYKSKVIFSDNSSEGNGNISLQGASTDFTINGNDSFGDVALSGANNTGDMGFIGNNVFSVTGNIGTARMTGNEIGNNTVTLTVTGWGVVVGNRCAPSGINVTGGTSEVAHNA